MDTFGPSSAIFHLVGVKDPLAFMINPYEPTSIHSRISRPTWKPYIALNVLLLSLPLLLAGGVFSMIILEQWRAERANGGDPVTYQHFFWIAPSATWTIVLYFLVPNTLLMLYLQWTFRQRATSTGRVQTSGDRRSPSSTRRERPEPAWPQRRTGTGDRQ